MSTTDTLDQERLGSEDIEFLKTLRRTFESMSKGKRSRVEGTAPETDSDTSSTNEPRSNSAWKANYKAYKVKSDELVQEIESLRQLFERTSGDQTERIIEELKELKLFLDDLDIAISNIVDLGSDTSVKLVVRRVRDLRIGCQNAENVLYLQKHAFTFIYLRRLIEACKTAENEFSSLTDVEAKLATIFNDIVPKLAKQNFPDLTNELRTFSAGVLPTYVIQDEERATTQYLALTTIATFFSSITATTLQFSYQQTSSGLSSAVNLFWFISLVFSVSSGINSLLSMIWRKSIVYTKFKPPKYINFWLTKSPVVFLAIAAFAFIVGLNLFPYSSGQQIYVSSATNVFTVLHVLGLLIVTSWYLVKLKWSSYFIQSVRRHFLWVLHYDDKVLPVNGLIAVMTRWPYNPNIHPHPFAKLLRHCVSVLIYFKRTSKEAIVPMYFWVKQHVLHLLSKFARGVFKLTLTAITGAKHAFCTLLRHLKHLHFMKSNTILRDPEVGDNHTSGGSDNAVYLDSEGGSEVDRTVENFISSLHKTFPEQYLHSFIKMYTDRWRNGIHPTDAMLEYLRNMLWGYPALYRQFEEEVLPAIRSRGVSLSEGSGQPSVATLPPITILRPEDVGRRAEHAGESTTGLASDLKSGHVTGLVSSDGDVNTLDQNSASISSTVEPTSAVGNQGIGKAPSLSPIAEQAEAAQASDEDNVKALGKQGSKADSKAGEGPHARTPVAESSPMLAEIIEMEGSDADSDWVTESDSSHHGIAK